VLSLFHTRIIAAFIEEGKAFATGDTYLTFIRIFFVLIKYHLKHKKIHAIKYKNNYIRKCPVYVEKILICDNSDYIPNKRLYPTACDYEFCMRLKERGYELPFTSPDDREKTQYYGYTLEDVIPVCVSCKGNKNPYEYCQKCKKENR
jgi:hypothetical protein